MPNTFTYDVGTDLGDVRTTIFDVDFTVTTGARTTWTAIFTDEELNRILARAGNNVFRASAWALLTMAAHKSLLAKRIAAGPYSEDMTVVARECRATAKDLLEQAVQADLDAGGTELLQEMPWTDFALDQILDNEEAAV